MVGRSISLMVSGVVARCSKARHRFWPRKPSPPVITMVDMLFIRYLEKSVLDLTLEVLLSNTRDYDSPSTFTSRSTQHQKATIQ